MKTLISFFCTIIMLTAAMTAPSHAADQQRTITVNSQLNIPITPTEIVVSLAVQHEADSGDAANAALSATLDDIKTALAAYGVRRVEVNTSNLQIRTKSTKERVYQPDGQYDMVAKTWHTVTANHELTFAYVKDTAGMSLAMMVPGVTKFNNLTFRAEPGPDIFEAARNKAIEQAKAEARQIARALDMRVGKPSRVSVSQSSRQPTLTARTLSEMKVSVSANITFELVE